MRGEAVTIHIDGAARGNPGPAAFAFVIAAPDGRTIEESGLLGTATNNVAEYTALVRALEYAQGLGAHKLQIHSDSELLVKQMNGEYRVKNPDLQVLYKEAKDLAAGFDSVTLRHVPRAQNAVADRLCNEALDGGRRGKAPAPKAALMAASPRADGLRADAVACLRSAAEHWARGRADDPPPELVWEQLWSILEENGVVRG